MTDLSVNPDQQQSLVNDYFQSAAHYWREIYQDERLLPVIYRARHAAILRWVEELRLAHSSQVLEIGCGAGMMTLALADYGYQVAAIDSTPAMIEMTRQKAAATGLAHNISISLGDAHTLAFQQNRFDLVIAIGVIPWLHSEQMAIREMARVLKPGGYLIVTADNQARLNILLDPLSTPLLTPAQKLIKILLEICGLRARSPQQSLVKKHYPWQIDRLITAAGLQKIESTSLGFGPFTFCGKAVLSEFCGINLHNRLELLKKMPGLRWTGSHYLVLARKQIL